MTGLAATLPAGTYYLAVGRFYTPFGATNWTVTSDHPGTANNRALLTIGTGSEAIPEPGTVGLIGLGLSALWLRRRS